jgi:tetratricopeptide (TPR) repeat protein
VDPAARGQYAEIEAQARRFGLSEVAVQAARTLADALLTVEDHSAESAAGAALDRALDTALAAGDESAFEIAAQLEELGTGYGDGYLAYLSWWAAQAHELLKAGPAEAEQAADVLRQLLGRVDRMGDRAQALVDRNEVLFALAECEAAVGDYQEAIACLDEALHGFRAKSAHLREGATANILATLYLELGEFETAASYAKLDIRICAELQDMLGEAKTRFVLARIRQAAGRPRAARAEYRRCVTLLRGVGSDEAEFMIRAIEQMLKQAPEEET